MLWVAMGVTVAVAVDGGCCGLLWVAVGEETLLPMLPCTLK